MFGLVDGNNFYCSCERVFNPTLTGRPVVVLSNNDGCVISRSNEAKALGIKMGVPAHEIKPIIEKYNVAVFSSNYALYGDMSARVMTTLATFAPEIEVYSIDECFLDFHGFENYNLFEYAHQIIKTTTQATGIPVSIGIAPTKTLAKLANKLAKKTPESKGVCLLTDKAKIDAVLKSFPIEDIWGIGRQHSKKLAQMGIHTAADFITLSRDWVQKNMTIVGVRMWEELKGKPCYTLETIPQSKKNICTSRSFGKSLSNYKDIEEAVSNHAASCAEKLRKQNSCTSVITVFIRTNPFKPLTPQYSNSITITLPHPSNDSFEVIKSAKQALKAIFKEGYHYKKAGVMVHELTPENIQQLNIFRNNEQDEKHKKLMQAMDKINMQFGRNKVKAASQGISKNWKLKQEKLSPSYTTKFKDIVKIG